MNRIFIDMDGVLADFDGLKQDLGVDGDTMKRMPGCYMRLQPMPDAISSVRSLIGMGYECWVATKPPTGISQAYADKAAWVLQWLPELKRHIIITHDKGLLGERGDFLVDDKLHKANCRMFKGVILEFGRETGWPPIMEYFRSVQAGVDFDRRTSAP